MGGCRNSSNAERSPRLRLAATKVSHTSLFISDTSLWKYLPSPSGTWVWRGRGTLCWYLGGIITGVSTVVLLVDLGVTCCGIVMAWGDGVMLGTEGGRVNFFLSPKLASSGA